MEGKKGRVLMLLFSTHITNRLRYVAAFIGSELHNQPIRVTDNLEEFQQHEGPKINYTHEQMDGHVVNIAPHSLVFEEGIRPQEIQCVEWNRRKAFFRVANSDIEFDIFAAVFYLISRYEEYLTHEKDVYGRYDHTNSLAFKEEFLHVPLVNYWLEDLRLILKRIFPDAFFHRHTFKFIPTTRML